MRNPLLVGAAVAALLLTGGGVALAQTTPPPAPSCGEALLTLAQAQREYDALPDTVPNPALPGLTAAVPTAQTALDEAKALVVEYSPDVYPGGDVPTVDEVTPALLAAMLADPDLGGGARTEVESAVTAFAKLAAAQAALAAAPATVPNPALSDGPEFDALTDARDAADAACSGADGADGQNGQNGSDGSDGADGTDGADGADFSQVDPGDVPQGGVATGYQPLD